MTTRAVRLAFEASRGTRGALVALVTTLAACGGRVHGTQPNPSRAFRIGHQVMWVDAGRGRIFSLDPVTTATGSVGGGRGATFVAPTQAHDALLVLAPGREAVLPGEKTEVPSLSVITPGATAPVIGARYELPAPYDQLALASDGGAAIAYYGPAATSTALFRNPNELALLDLRAAPGSANPQARTIRSLGSAPTAIAFSPDFTVPGTSGPRRFAVVLSTGYVTLLDLTHPGRPEITVPLSAPGSGATMTPAQVLFAPASGTIFIRVTGGSDLFALVLSARPSSDPDDNDYRPSINQPSTGAFPLDMILALDSGRAILVTTNLNGTISLIDPTTSEHATFAAGAGFGTITGVPAATPSTLLLYSRETPSAVLGVLELQGVITQRERNLSLRTLARPVHDLVVVPGDQKAMVVHDGTRTVLSILDLGPRRIDTPIEGHTALASFDFMGGSYLLGASSAVPRLGVIDLATSTPSDVRLDYTPTQVLAVGDRIVIDHGAREGLVTVLAGPTAGREHAHIVWGMFLEGALDPQAEDN